ncbi:hypothetical protein [uncultured Chryseobacterium sp.]|uniref:hypothetical protein n=1 Tax=uncultured Chryseobacterium sp. TaxID=259322 RepID=UPI00258ECACB|nr:hypothetical protein [uncultured Chryseobacterium sp.]
MEITGHVTKVTNTFIRVRTIRKRQEIDVFYTQSRERAIFYRFEEHIITTIEVELQEVEVEGAKYAKLWLKYVILPAQLRDEDYSSRLTDSPFKITSILYKKNA